MEGGSSKHFGYHKHVKGSYQYTFDMVDNNEVIFEKATLRRMKVNFLTKVPGLGYMKKAIQYL